MTKTLTDKITALEMEYLKGQNHLGALQAEVEQTKARLSQIQGGIVTCKELLASIVPAEEATPAPAARPEYEAVAEEPGTEAAERRRLKR